MSPESSDGGRTVPSGLSALARQSARDAGERLLDRFRSSADLAVERKGLHDYVTEVDREAERTIVARIRERHPDHAILAEEGSPDAARSDTRWIIDPLDGTTNFIHQLPTFAVSIAVEDDAGLAVGVVYVPVLDEMFHAVRGEGAFLNDRPIRCSETSELETALIATGFPFRDFSKADRYLDTLRWFMSGTSGIRRAGSAAIDLAYTAAGRHDAFFEVGLAPWDVAAGALLVTEAGGKVTDVDGRDGFLETGEIVAAGRGLHRRVLDEVRPRLGNA